MNLRSYLFLRLFLYFMVLNTALALLYNLVEFFEKIMRVAHASIPSIILYVLLSIVPTFFELIPISSVIAMYLMIKELSDRGEWETLFLLGIRPGKLIALISTAGLLLSMLSFIGKEILAVPLARHAEKIRLQEFKGQQEKKLFDYSIMVNNNKLIHFDFLDQATCEGTGLIIIILNNAFKMEKIIAADTFKTNPQTKSITIIDGIKTNLRAHKEKKVHQYEIALPDLFSQLLISHSMFGFTNLLSQLFVAYSLANKTVFNLELGLFCDRMLKHFQPLIYSILLLCLFLLFYAYSPLRWIVLIFPYPVFIVSTNVSIFLLHHGSSWFVIFLPYMGAFLLLFFMLYLFSNAARKFSFQVP